MNNASTSKWLFVSGWLLVASGIFHVFVWLILGGEWEGAVSWRKPILFGASAGMTVLSFGWVYGKIASRTYDWILIPGFALAMLAEVALITMQQWRGVPSHFNRASDFNAQVETWITILIIVASIAITDLSIRSFVSVKGSQDTKLAIKSGLTFLLISIGIGFAISFYGQQLMEQNRNPSIYGDSGVMKFPHGVAIHAIQLFPAILFLLKRKGLDEHQRTAVLQTAIVAIVFFLAFSIYQTLIGVGRFHPTWIGIALLGCTLISIATGLYLTFFSTRPLEDQIV